MRALRPDLLAGRPDPDPSLASHPDTSPGLLLARLGRGAAQIYRDALVGTGLKPPHVATLVKLRADPVGQQALGEATELDPVKLVGVLNDLEAAGLVERRRDALDRRRHIVAITCAGRERLGEVERASAAAEDRLLAGLDLAQREQLAQLLRLVVQTSRVGEVCPGATESERADDCGSPAADDDPCGGP